MSIFFLFSKPGESVLPAEFVQSRVQLGGAVSFGLVQASFDQRLVINRKWTVLMSNSKLFTSQSAPLFMCPHIHPAGNSVFYQKETKGCVCSPSHHRPGSLAEARLAGPRGPNYILRIEEEHLSLLQMEINLLLTVNPLNSGEKLNNYIVIFRF